MAQRVPRPAARCDPMDVKELLKTEMRRTDAEVGYNRFGTVAALTAGSGDGLRQFGPPYVPGTSAVLGDLNSSFGSASLPPGMSGGSSNAWNGGVLDWYFLCDSRYKDPSSVLSQGQLAFSLIRLNNGKAVDKIIEMEIGEFYIPVVDNFPFQLPQPQVFFYKRNYLQIIQLNTQAIFGPNNSKYHWELDLTPDGIDYRASPVNKKFIFGRPFQETGIITFQFTTPTGPLALPQDVFTGIPLSGTAPGRFLSVLQPTVLSYRYLVAPFSPSVTLTAAAGALSAGTYRWLVTYVTYYNDGIAPITRIGETNAGLPSVVVTANVNDRGDLINIPVDIWSPTTQVYPLNNIDQRALTRRRIYRTLANGDTFYFVTEIADNTTTAYNDANSDATIAGNATAPALNNSGGPSNLLAPTDLTLQAQLPVPNAPTLTYVSGGGRLASSAVGGYRWAFTFINAKGETVPGPAALTTFTTNVGDSVLLTNIPLGDPGTLARNVYRVKAGGTQLFFVDTINDNITTSFTDTVADTALENAPPVVNTTGNNEYTVYISGMNVANGELNAIINRTRGHLITAPDANTIELTNTSLSNIPTLPYPPPLNPPVPAGGPFLPLASLTGVPTTVTIVIGYRRIAFPIRFRTVVDTPTNKIVPV